MTSILKMKIYVAILAIISTSSWIGCASLGDIHNKLASSATSKEPVYLDDGIFVSVSNGNDTNTGTNRSYPVKSLPMAVSNAAAFGLSNIYVALGTYLPGNGLSSVSQGVIISNRNISLFGGYDESFTDERIGFSVLNGTNSTNYYVVKLLNISNVRLEGFVACNGISGCYISNAYGLSVVDMVLSNNSTYRGMTLFGNSNIISNCVFSTNRGQGFAGGLDVNGDNNYISGYFYKNGIGTTTWGGAVRLNGSSNTLTGTITNNTSQSYGGGVVVYRGTGNVIRDAVIIDNYAVVDSGGIRIYVSTNTLVSNCIISRNRVSQYWSIGSGLFLQVGVSNTVTHCYFYSNQAFNTNVMAFGGCINVNGSDGDRIVNCVLTNNYSGDRDAVFALDSNTYSITGLLISNNIIGGTNGSSACGIFEYNGDTTGHMIVNNRFVSNAIGYLYWNNATSTVVTNNVQWTNINVPGFITAAVASGNTLQ